MVDVKTARKGGGNPKCGVYFIYLSILVAGVITALDGMEYVSLGIVKGVLKMKVLSIEDYEAITAELESTKSELEKAKKKEQEYLTDIEGKLEEVAKIRMKEHELNNKIEISTKNTEEYAGKLNRLENECYTKYQEYESKIKELAEKTKTEEGKKEETKDAGEDAGDEEDDADANKEKDEEEEETSEEEEEESEEEEEESEEEEEEEEAEEEGERKRLRKRTF